jgi:hypothetical protein
MPHTVPEDYPVLIAFADVFGVWFLQVDVSQT